MKEDNKIQLSQTTGVKIQLIDLFKNLKEKELIDLKEIIQRILEIK